MVPALFSFVASVAVCFPSISYGVDRADDGRIRSFRAIFGEGVENNTHVRVCSRSKNELRMIDIGSKAYGLAIIFGDLCVRLAMGFVALIEPIETGGHFPITIMQVSLFES